MKNVFTKIDSLALKNAKNAQKRFENEKNMSEWERKQKAFEKAEAFARKCQRAVSEMKIQKEENLASF